MDEIKIEDIDKTDDYIPEDPNAPVDDFEISEIVIENYMPEDLKNAIKRYNDIHKRTVEDLLENEDIEEDNTTNDSDIIEDKNNNLDLKNIF